MVVDDGLNGGVAVVASGGAVTLGLGGHCVVLSCGERQERPSDGEFFDLDSVVIGDSDFGIAEVHSLGYLLDNANVAFPNFLERFFSVGKYIFFSLVIGGVVIPVSIRP